MMREPILIVDDEEDLRNVLGDALRRDGYRVEAAESVEVALDLLETRRYPVIVTDLNLPGGLSGFDLIAAVRARDPLALCVVITGYASTETAIRALKQGAYDFVKKPFRLAEMEAVIDRALDHGRVLREVEGYRQDLEARVLERMRDLRDLHAEATRLNDLLVEGLGGGDEAAFLGPFLDHLEARWKPAGLSVLLPDGEGWSRVAARGGRPWPGDVAPPPDPWEPQDWTWRGGWPHGILVPLVRAGEGLGLLHLGFEERPALDPEDAAFALWRRQVVAGLHGTRCIRRAGGAP